MLDKKMIAMLMTLSMLAAAFAGCLGGEDEDDDWTLMPADDVSADMVTSDWGPNHPQFECRRDVRRYHLGDDEDGCARASRRLHSWLLHK